jgi:hypothetical protein
MRIKDVAQYVTSLFAAYHSKEEAFANAFSIADDVCNYFDVTDDESRDFIQQLVFDAITAKEW